MQSMLYGFLYYGLQHSAYSISPTVMVDRSVCSVPGCDFVTEQGVRAFIHVKSKLKSK